MKIKVAKIRMLLYIISFAITLISCESQDTDSKKKTNTKDYSTFLKEIETKRNEFNVRYNNSDSNQKISVINETRNYIFETITSDIFTYWYGTPWDFNGTTRIPKQGSIACGFFVTTVLKDAGFNIPRVKWAQSASEAVIIKLATDDIKRFSNKPISEVEKYLKNKGDGLYVVGLDCHVGYIVVKDNKVKFVHSNYYQPDIGVMSENIDTNNPLKNSKYRIIGKLLSDEMIINWINNTEYK